MPVSLTVVHHEATSYKHANANTPEEVFKECCPKQSRGSPGIIQSSVPSTELREKYISPSKNGFVWAAYHAYNYHHHLTIRPEDVWFSILTQVGFYINANAEKMRSYFVAHEGKKELEVLTLGTMRSANFGAIAKVFMNRMAKDVKDPELRTWIMPSFTTTNDTDCVIASVLFMGAMQSYYSFIAGFYCGLPSVTLLGEVSDWEDILARLEKLEQFGDEPTIFARMLKPILRCMILSFKEPTNPDVIQFWNTIATHTSLGSGTNCISGWIGAFCFWDENGKRKTWDSHKFSLDGVAYPTIEFDKVPLGFASVPVTVDDNGTIHECTMLAGSLGIQATSCEDRAAANGSQSTAEELGLSSFTAIRSFSGWLIYENEPAEAVQQREKKKQELEDQLKDIKQAIRSSPIDERKELWEQKWLILQRLDDLKLL